MPQRMKDYGRISINRMYQTITTAGDVVEGAATVGTSETNVLEMVAQNFKSFFIEGRNTHASQTCTFKIYGTRKFIESVPATGDAHWTATGAHWAILDTQSTVAALTNTTPKEFIDKGYTYLLVTAQGSGSGTTLISRAMFTTY